MVDQGYGAFVVAYNFFSLFTNAAFFSFPNSSNNGASIINDLQVVETIVANMMIEV